MRDDRDKLRDILDAIQHIEERLPKGSDAYYADALIQIWIMHHLQIIGEASARLSAGMRDSHPEVPWSDVIGMRNALVHHYFGIDIEEVWDTATKYLPAFKRRIQAMLAELSGDE